MPAEALTWLCRAYGSTTIRRAYGDWADPRLLVTVMEQITTATPTASAVKSKMVVLAPTFDPVNYDGLPQLRWQAQPSRPHRWPLRARHHPRAHQFPGGDAP